MDAIPRPLGIDSAKHAGKEGAMSDRTQPTPTEDPEPASGDPDDGSTWSTIDGTAEIEELVNEDDLEDFLVEPIPDPLANPLDMNNS
jgi:hypothetical protein